MVYSHKKKIGESPRLDMTPMIDVVFQLLIFFVVTLKQEDILSKLVASRPSVPERIDPTPEQPGITVSAQGFMYGDRALRLSELERVLEQRARISKKSMLIIKCTKDSPHALLIQALDVCSKNELDNLSILSL